MGPSPFLLQDGRKTQPPVAFFHNCVILLKCNETFWRRFEVNAKKTTEKGLLGAVFCLADKILRLCSRVEAIPGKRPEIRAVLLYAAAHLIMAIFHEPWYDEAVAWQIARCASVRDILFEIPHYEGHPPLWHLILLPFAKLGAPYELSLSLVSLIFAGAAVGLIIWKSPFPRIVRLLLPFTYFYFYQYGVIARPYCVMMLAFVLLAMAYPTRNTKPGRYTLGLMLLCLTSAYGIVIAGGLAMVWVWEIWELRNIGAFLRTFPKDKRIHWLAALLALALLLIASLLPRTDTFATASATMPEGNNSFLLCFLYTLLALPADLCLTSLYNQYGFLKYMEFPPLSLLTVCLTGGILWLFAIHRGRSTKTLAVLVLPYGLFALFTAMVYLSLHHIGIGLLLIVFWLWVSCQAEAAPSASSSEELRTVAAALRLLAAAALVISLWWNVTSCVKDVFTVYSAGRNEAAFISEHGLDRYRIMVGWDTYYDDDDNLVAMDINHTRADTVAPYFQHNLFFNFNGGENALNYSTHKCASEEETLSRLSQWKENPPDVLFLKPRLELVYDEEALSMRDYTLVYTQLNHLIWKGISNYGRAEIYVRNDLAQELGLAKVEPEYPFLVEFLTRLNERRENEK